MNAWDHLKIALKLSPVWIGILFFAIIPILVIAFLFLIFLVLYHWTLVVAPNSTTYENIKESFEDYYKKPYEIKGKYRVPICVPEKKKIKLSAIILIYLLRKQELSLKKNIYYRK